MYSSLFFFCFFSIELSYPLLYIHSALTANIRQRRGSKVCIRVPVFKDCRTFIGPYLKGQSADPSEPNGNEDPTPDSDAGGILLQDNETEDTKSKCDVFAPCKDMDPSGSPWDGYQDPDPEEPDWREALRQVADDTECCLRNPFVDEVYMDAMAFGMGCCCLQVTFQARDLQESRNLYDQLNVLSPIMVRSSLCTRFERRKKTMKPIK